MNELDDIKTVATTTNSQKTKVIGQSKFYDVSSIETPSEKQDENYTDYGLFLLQF